MFKRYYDDDGILNHDWIDSTLLQDLTNALAGIEPSEFYLSRAEAMEIASDIIFNYDISVALSSSPKTESGFLNDGINSPLRTALIRMFFEFIGTGYMPSEFRLAAWDAVCMAQINIQLSGLTPY